MTNKFSHKKSANQHKNVFHSYLYKMNSNRLEVNLSNLDLINKFKQCNNVFIAFRLLYLPRVPIKCMHIQITFYEEDVVNKNGKNLLAPP